MDCIVCHKDLPNIAGAINQPNGGSEFVTEGHYGSRVTDFMDGTKHIINVCDDCLTAAKARGDTVLVWDPENPPLTYDELKKFKPRIMRERVAPALDDRGDTCEAEPTGDPKPTAK
jgi:hypothetical protein